MTIRAVDGRNALDFAIDCGNVECAQVLIRSETWKDSLRNRTESICSGICNLIKQTRFMLIEE